MPSPTSALSFLRIVGKLKQLSRTGWLPRGVAGTKSVVHDLAEALAGDIAPFQKVSKEEKRRLEEEGLEKIYATIGSDLIADSVKQASKCTDRNERDRQYATALSHLTSADRIDNMSELSWVGKVVFYLCQAKQSD